MPPDRRVGHLDVLAPLARPAGAAARRGPVRRFLSVPLPAIRKKVGTAPIGA